MWKDFVGGIISLITIISFVYLKYNIKRYQNFIENIEKSTDFYNKISDYTGYVICVEQHTIINELDLLRGLLNGIKKNDKCIIVDLSDNYLRNKLNVKLVEKLHITIIPSILYIYKGTDIQEIFNFKQFEGLTDKEIIFEVSNFVR